MHLSWKKRDRLESFSLSAGCVVTFSSHSQQGQRDYQEDTASHQRNARSLVVGVFDGHYGSKCSEWTAGARHAPTSPRPALHALAPEM